MKRILLNLALSAVFISLAACSSGDKKKPNAPPQAATQPPPVRDCTEFRTAETLFLVMNIHYREFERANDLTKLSKEQRQVVNSAVLTERYLIHIANQVSPLQPKQQNEIVRLYKSIFDSEDRLRSQLEHPLKNNCL